MVVFVERWVQFSAKSVCQLLRYGCRHWGVQCSMYDLIFFVLEELGAAMGTFVSRNVFLTTEFACRYVRRMYCEIFVRVIFRVIQLIPKTLTMGFVNGSHHGASLCRLIVHPAA